MPDFMITAPDGRQFKITAPEGANVSQLPDFGGVKTEKAPPVGPQSSVTESFKAGFMDPFVGAEQLARHSGLGDDEEYDVYVRQREQELRDKGVSGGFNLPRAAGSAVNPINLMSPGARVAGFLPRVVAGAIGGAAGAATQPVTGEDFALEKGEQAIEGLGAGSVLGGLSRLARYRDYTPTLADLRRDGGALYDQLMKSNSYIRRSATDTLATVVEQQLTSRPPFFREGIAPETFAAVRELRSMPWLQPGQQPTIMDIDQIQQVLKHSLTSPDRREAAAARTAQDIIDQYISNIPTGAIVSGNPQADAATLREAQAIWRAYRRSQAIEERAHQAELRTGSTGTASNIDNATRQEIRKLLNSREGRRFSQAERDDLESIVMGTPTANALRYLGKFAPQGAVSGMPDVLSLMSGHVKPTLLKSAIAIPAKLGGDMLTRRAARQTAEAIRRQSPTTQGVPPTAPPWYLRMFQPGAVAAPTAGALLGQNKSDVDTALEAMGIGSNSNE